MFVALPFLIFYASFSLLLGIYDARTGLLPDRFTCPLLWGGLLYHQICLPERLPDALWGAIAGYGGFALIYWGYRLRYQKEGLGYGDVKYLAALGAWHCWEYSAANYLIPICILFDTDKKQTTANYLIPNPPLFDGF